MIDALRFLPRFVRQRLVLDRIHLDEARLRGVRVKIAETREEIFGAARLVHDAYVARGILAPHATRLKIGPQLVLPTTFTFVAIAAGEVVGTMALVLDSPLRLPMDGSFRDDVDRLRATGESLAEISALAIAPAFRNSGVVYGLNRIMARTACAIGVERLVMTVHPRAQVLYETALLFERFSARERVYAGLAGDARAVAMTLSVRGVADRYRATFGRRGAHPSNAAWMNFDGPLPWVEEVDVPAVLGSAERIDAIEALARTRMDTFRGLSDAELSYLRRTLDGVLWPSPSRPAFYDDDLAPLGAAVPA